MGKCAVCGKFVSAKGCASCCKCSNKLHLACAHLPESAKVNPKWRCQDCKVKKAKVTSQANASKGTSSNDDDGSLSSPGNINTSFEDAADTHGYNQGRQNTTFNSQMDICQQIQLVRTEISEMKDELKNDMVEFCREMADLRQSIAGWNKRFDTLEKRLEALEIKSPEIHSGSRVSQLESTVAQLQMELNERDQELLSSDLEIANLPEESGENTIHVVELVAKKLGITIEASDIVYAERVGHKVERSDETGGTPGVDGAKTGDGGRGRRIVVRLARRQLRDELLRSARVRRQATSAELGFAAPPRRFYINERLTKNNKLLFYRVRQATNRLGWRYAWTKHGKILVKQGDGKRTFNVRSMADFERVFGRDISNTEEK